MADYIDLEEAKGLYLLDIGGTPANLLAKDKIGLFLSRGIRPEQLVAVVDPFDLSRVERSLELSDAGSVKRIKFSVEVGDNEKVSSEKAEPPAAEEILRQFLENKGRIVDAVCNKYGILRGEPKKRIGARYDLLQARVIEISQTAPNLREFMNRLVELLSPFPLRIKKLEGVLAENLPLVREVLKNHEIKARVFCPDCGKMTPYSFNLNKLEEKVCCSNADAILRAGSYVPEEGMLPALVYMAGINPCIAQGREYGLKAIEFLKSMGEFKRPLVMYSGRPERTMFEAFMLREGD
jgi:hypothetical protein